MWSRERVSVLEATMRGCMDGCCLSAGTIWESAYEEASGRLKISQPDRLFFFPSFLFLLRLPSRTPSPPSLRHRFMQSGADHRPLINMADDSKRQRPYSTLETIQDNPHIVPSPAHDRTPIAIDPQTNAMRRTLHSSPRTGNHKT